MNAQHSDQIPIIAINETVSQVNINASAQLLRTHSRNQLSQVQALEGWSQQTNNIPLNKDQALWQRFSLSYQDNVDQQFLLTINNPSIDYLDAYVLDDKNRLLETYLVGAKRDLETRPFNHRNFVLPISLAPYQTVNIYLRIQDEGPTVYNLNVWKGPAFVADEQFNLAFIGVIGGGLAILFFYFLVTYVLLRSPIRFWFAVANAGLLLLFLNIQGIVSQFAALGSYTSEINSVTVAILIFAAAKVCHAMLSRVPIYLRFLSYLMALSLIIIAPLLNSYYQIISAASFAAAAVLLHLLLAVIYHNRQYSISNRLYAFGWLIISATVVIEVHFYLSGRVSNTDLELLMSLVIMSGALLIAVAIESHEKAVAFEKQIQQQNAIDNLHQFYDLFRNSAEGLYTSTPEGKLVTTNPAMCQLFGYKDETQMLSEVKDTSLLYANPHERDLLLEEIYQAGVALGKEVKGVRRDGSEFWFCISIQLTGNDDEKYFFGSIFDITEKKQSTISLEYLATHDSLTGVYNRRQFEQKLREGIRRSKQLKQALTLLYMDLDQFKVVNDTCGHKAGDALIKQLSQLLNDVVMNKGMLARLGGDEFGVILESENALDAIQIAEKLLAIVKEFRFIWDNRIFAMGMRIGLAKWQENIETPEQLMSMADAACYVAKEHGRNQIHVYSSEDLKMQRYESELKWVSQINTALEQNKFQLYYQHYFPLSKVADGHYYEILLRMHDENGQIVPPAAFLPAAERYNLTIEIDKWVILHTFKWLAQHPEHLSQLKRCNINLSGHSLADNDLKRHVIQAFETYEIPHDKICFEITESMAIVKMEETLRFITAFRRLGCTFALDDFGSGFSSYSYLKNLPVNCVKIDGSFVKDLLVDPVDMAMVCSMKDVAKAMSMSTVAEFVESKDVMVELGKIGVDFAQGYGVAKPAALDEFTPCKTID
ncbi:EAL domain-containing protein [Aliiglaciecola lipolytica]|uniref:Diguanylate cyclase/phosphodiesterase with PAS/PAC sensor(S) n=1 Tax=Aliiglaciecola lipolytica E3 TaxID=1127673 RepID=K6YBD9_9ALTE|nr:EAL domain-containing protein [Aliiglaciecola lipolytica]GAC15502.1 diguanylate cyclase/phosphodiesterase with PAS/PAC sensor(s) [Aliiglaciecola lipolytica E3]